MMCVSELQNLHCSLSSQIVFLFALLISVVGFSVADAILLLVKNAVLLCMQFGWPFENFVRAVCKG